MTHVFKSLVNAIFNQCSFIVNIFVESRVSLAILYCHSSDLFAYTASKKIIN